MLNSKISFNHSSGCILSCIAAFLFGFIVISSTFNHLFNLLDGAWPSHDMLLGKIDWLTSNSAEYDTLFLGPSYVLTGVDVAKFDKLTTKRGYPTHSFSLSAGQLDRYEEFVVLRTLRKNGKIHPKYVFIDLSLEDEMRDFNNTTTERRRRVHNLQNTWDGCKFVFQSHSRLPLLAKLKQCGRHLGLYFCNLVGIGRFAAIEQNIYISSIDKEDINRIRNGFLPIHDVQSEFRTLGAAGFNKLLEQKKREILKQRKANEIISSNIRRYEYLDVNLIIREVRSMGAEPIFLITPNSWSNGIIIKKIADSQKVPMFDYSDPDTYPAIYDYKNFSNKNHFLSEGAQLFSETLANEFCKHLQKAETKN